jgi:hypothetical protein
MTPFKRFTVHTDGASCNRFTVYVSDLEGVLADYGKDKLPNADKLALERAVFIQQAIDEKLERGK